MTKLRIKLVSLGDLPYNFDNKRIEKWTSKVFEITEKIETYQLPRKSDLEGHAYSDKSLSEKLPDDFNGDILIAITSVPLELNWYSRRLSNNRVCFSFFQTADSLIPNNIPIENLVLKLLYSYTLIYRRFRNRLPESSESTNFTHSDTRKCLFDFNGIKSQVIHSTIKPIICEECTAQLLSEKVSKELIDKIKKELSGIKKNMYYRISDFIKKRPILSLTISILSALLLGIIGSLIYDNWIKDLITITAPTMNCAKIQVF